MGLRSILRFLSSHLAIDLGTTNSLLYVPGSGILVNEPSVVAVNRMTGEVLAIGQEAKEMVGRTPANIAAIKPIMGGVIADFDLAEEMLKYFIKKAHARRYVLAPPIAIGIPSEITQVERRAIVEAARGAKASHVYLIEQPVAAAVGVGLPITEPSGSMVIDIGGGTTDIAVISLCGIVYSRTLRVAGDQMDEAIIQYMKRKYNLLIGERTAEQTKIAIGSAAPRTEKVNMEIRGRSFIEGVPKTVPITGEEVREALTDTIDAIVNAVRVALERTPPELSADIADRGIVLTGGGALLKGLDQRISREIDLPVRLAEDPLSSVVMGTARILENRQLLQRVALS